MKRLIMVSLGLLLGSVVTAQTGYYHGPRQHHGNGYNQGHAHSGRVQGYRNQGVQAQGQVYSTMGNGYCAPRHNCGSFCSHDRHCSQTRIVFSTLPYGQRIRITEGLVWQPGNYYYDRGYRLWADGAWVWVEVARETLGGHCHSY